VNEGLWGTEAINYQSSRHLGLISVGNGKGLMGQYGKESINYPSFRHLGLNNVGNVRARAQGSPSSKYRSAGSAINIQ
jgi:hypothetical protein